MEPENVLIAPTRSAAGIKLLLASLFGIAIFFIPFELAGRSTIMVDHLAGFLIAQRPLAVGLILLLIGYGAITPLLDSRWRARPIDRLLSLFKLIGLVLALMYVANLGPAWLMTPDRLPFLFDKLAMSVGLIVPIGAMALTFLLGFGLLELIGVLMQPVMRPLWRTPGHSAIDAVASFVGSYSVELLITNRVFLAGKYTVREAVIIATGFSTVSATFMIIVAKTLNLMEHWNFYFWSTLVITFVITAILARVPPISNMAHHGETDEPLPAILLKDADLLVRYVTAVVSVSSVLFFSASIPCILATRIPVSVGQLVVIWLLRPLLGIVLAALCGKLAMAAGWLS
ncbi:YjiH family protein [Aeromonas salmonicida]|uniref:YjiH family protein n=1 Tax=Aeromonas salmonicida TaxID=645 RepID=UPI0012D8BF82|nr:nucleoside recognition domain-containing protein [Aeromonas salmonicida]MUG28365.1 YjiH family protein [Aeromonas salmonicida]